MSNTTTVLNAVNTEKDSWILFILYLSGNKDCTFFYSSSLKTAKRTKLLPKFNASTLTVELSGRIW